MKELKEEMLKYMFNKSGFVSRLEDDGTKYGSINMDAVVHNPMLGITTPRKVKVLEDKGAIAYEDKIWKIQCEMIEVNSENKDRFRAGRHLGEKIKIPTKAWYDYMDGIRKETQWLIANT